MAGAGVFVGRDAELRALGGSLDEAAAGRGGFVAVAGDPGIGKSRTLEEFVVRAALPEDRILWGRCSADEGAPAYWPWTQAIRGYVERCDAAALRAQLGPGAADLAQLVPAVRDRLPDVATAPHIDPQQSRFRLFDAMATFLRRASADRPLLLVLDDLHWADRASILLLAFVAPEIRRSRTLVVGTYRELEMRRTPDLLADVARAGTRISLRGLDRGQTRDLIQRTAAVAATDRLVERLHRVTEGNPYFLGELLRWLRAEGRLVDDADTAALGLPEEVREAIRRHLAPLADEDRKLLAAAAVVGREFELAPLQHVCDLTAEQLLERLAGAAAAGLLAEMPGVVGRFRFAHALVRETLYEDLVGSSRVDLQACKLEYSIVSPK